MIWLGGMWEKKGSKPRWQRCIRLQCAVLCRYGQKQVHARCDRVYGKSFYQQVFHLPSCRSSYIALEFGALGPHAVELYSYRLSTEGTQH